MINFLENIKKSRIKKNISGNTLHVFCLFLIQLFHLPLMIYLWGIEKTGLWIYLLAIPNLLSFWKLNFSEASKQELILKKFLNKNEIYSISFLLTILTILFFAIIYFTVNLKFIHLFEIFRNIEINNYNWILILIFASFSIDLITNNFLTISQYTGKIYRTQILVSIFTVMEKIFIPFIGFFTEQLFYAAIYLLLVKMIKYSSSIYIMKKYTISLSLNFKNLNRNKINDIFKKSTSFYFNDLSNVINVSGFIYFIGYFFVAEVVTMITALQTLFKFLILWIYGIFDNVLRYEFANFYKNKQFLKIIKLYKYQKNLLYIILLLFFVMTYLVGKNIFDIWTGYIFIYKINLIYLVMIESIIFLLGYNQIILLYSLNRLKKISFYGLIINVLVLIILFSFESTRVNIETIYYVLIFKSLMILFINMIFNYKFTQLLLLKND